MENFNKLEMITLTGKIVLITGLHIGASNDSVQIGGIDSAVIRDPRTQMPYIPGSSLKGKLRSLAEWSNQAVLNKMLSREKKGDPCNCGLANCPVCVVFGSTGAVKGTDRGPTRLIVRDAVLPEGAEVYFEDKVENSIDRLKGSASNPRHIERIAPGAEFDFSMSYKILKDSDKALFKSVVLNAMGLLEKDYLGGSGSRGYGKIQFKELVYNGKTYGSLEDLIKVL